MHIHVAKQRGYAKFWLRPMELEKSRNFRGHELNEIAQLIEEHKDEIERKWRDHFSQEAEPLARDVRFTKDSIHVLLF